MERRIRQRGTWLSPQAASRELGLEQHQLLRLIDNGKIPAHRISRRFIRLRRVDVNRAKFLVGLPAGDGGCVRSTGFRVVEDGS